MANAHFSENGPMFWPAIIGCALGVLIVADLAMFIVFKIMVPSITLSSFLHSQWGF